MLENFNETERTRIVEYLEDLGQRAQTAFINGHANSEHTENPVPGLAACLVKCASLSAASAKKQARELIVELEARGWIDCRRSAAGWIKSIKIIRLSDRLAFEAKVINRRKEQAKILLEQAENQQMAAARQPGELRADRFPKRRHKVMKKGAARRLRKAWDRGNRNEARFGNLLNRLIEILRLYPEIVSEASFESSGRHNPKKGRIDTRDHHGEDFSLFILVEPDGRYRLIYDVKSAFKDVQQFNRKIYFTKEQRDACKKKAILVNKRRTDVEIIEEILQDLVDSGFSEILRCIQPILERFLSLA